MPILPVRRSLQVAKASLEDIEDTVSNDSTFQPCIWSSVHFCLKQNGDKVLAYLFSALKIKRNNKKYIKLY